MRLTLNPDSCNIESVYTTNQPGGYTRSDYDGDGGNDGNDSNKKQSKKGVVHKE